MDKTRVIILAVAVGLLGVGGYMVYEHQNQKAAQESEGLDSVPSAHREAVAKIKKLPTASTVPLTAQAPTTGGDVPASGITSTKPDATSPTTTKLAVATKSTATLAATPTAANPVKPAVSAVATTVQPPITPVKPAVAAKPVAAQPVTSKPVAPQPVVAVAPKVQAPAVAAQPTKPASPVAIKPAAYTFPNGPKLTEKPAAPPVRTAAKPAAAPVKSAAAPITEALASAPRAAAPTPAGKIAATSLAEALLTSKVGQGRQDPMQPVAVYKPFPTHSGTIASATDSVGDVPPPPDSDDPTADATPKATKSATKVGGLAGKIGKKINEPLVPPPPPTSETASADDSLNGLPIDQLPVPPSRPTIGDKLRVLAVLDNHAIVSFPTAMRLKNKWPKVLNLAQGEQFESITVVGVSKDGVTIEEDGERSLRPLSPVK